MSLYLNEVLWALLGRIALDAAAIAVLVHGVYLRRYPRREFAFTFDLLNVTTFAIGYLLSNSQVGVGLTLGLFAVFGILRYRTEALPIRDLTYLFVSIGIALVNGMSIPGMGWAQLLLMNVGIVLAVTLLEFSPTSRGEETLTVLYDRVELLAPSQRQQLLGDLSRRMGVQCKRVAVGRVDLLRESAEITVVFAREQEAV